MDNEWSFTLKDCHVNDDAFNELLDNSVTFKVKDVKVEPIKDEKFKQPLTVTVKVDVDTTEAESNIKHLTEMLSKANEEIEKMKNGMINFQPKDTFTTNYSNCTFLYGKYGRANVYNDCSEIDENEDVNFKDNERNCDCEDCDCSNK